MDYFVKEIELPSEFDFFTAFNIDRTPIKRLTNLSKINILVGANNSGKSRFMRLLAAQGKIKFKPNLDLAAINVIKRNAAEIVQTFKRKNAIEDIKVISDITTIPDYELGLEDAEFFGQLEHIFNHISSANSLGVLRGHIWGEDPRLTTVLKNEMKEVIAEYSLFRKQLPESFIFKKLYIPTLRGLRPLSEDQYTRDYYMDRTIKDYFNKLSKSSLKPEVFTGLSLFTMIRDLLLGDLSEREILSDFQKFLSDTFFENKPVALIPRKDSDVLHVKIGSELELPIYDLGDGIQSIIILTFPLFQRRNEKLLVFIEEPEMFMHPGLQRILLNTFLNFNNHQFFLTTHSNHFLDLSLDYEKISIYLFLKMFGGVDQKIISANFEVYNVSNESRKSLELLGVKNSSIFLSNCTIWVEGITDRKYIGHYFNLYQQHLKEGDDQAEVFREDTHYSFVEYSGANITHWSFLDESNSINVEYLCGRLFLITDQDDPEHKKKEIRHDKLKDKLGERYYRLSVREVENLLTPDILRKVLVDYGENESAIPDFKNTDYAELPLGAYIEDTLLQGNKQRTGKYAAESGTITQKSVFCDKAISHINKYDDLSEEVKHICKLLHNFIRSNNPK